MTGGPHHDEDTGAGTDPFLRELAADGVSPGEAMEALAEGVEAAPLPDGLRARMLAATETTARFASAAQQVARLVDLSLAAALDLLVGVDRAESWTDGPFPGIGLYNFEGGPEVRGAITGFVRMMPGAVFPHHRHVGVEQVLVLSGRFRDSRGQVAEAGDLAVNDPGTEHSFEVLPGPELFYLVVASGGVQIGDEHFSPEDPRL